MALVHGTRLGAYDILTLLGSGGMGEVYRAHDSKLNRDVAIKVLLPAIAHDPDRLARFSREAQVLASLNHPNIAAIFGVEDANGTPALVMELVEGPTLAERIARGPMAVRDALILAQQIADALDAAHEKGIVHRDLKPANIKLATDGAVKVLDFGLATAVGRGGAGQSGLETALVSKPGTVVGTAVYMSPEQTRGEAVDKRTDIWAFGCVLYELLTGRRAFDGATSSEVIAKVLEREPEWAALPAATPQAVRRLLARCLDKNPKRRVRDIGDVRVEIDDMSASSVTLAPVRRSRAWTAAPWVLLVVAAAGAAYVFARRPVSDDPFANFKVEALTNDPGFTGQAALSPDARLLAYASDRSGRGDLDIWVQQTTGGVPLRLTDDEADDQSPDFSPDGSQIVFRSERDGGGVYVVPALGGGARLVAREGRNPRFSPDGSRIAYWTGQVRGELMGRVSETDIISLAGGAPTRVMKEFAVASNPVWSPDGRGLLILGVHDRNQAANFDWWWAPVDGGPPVQTGIMDWEDLRAEANRPNVVWTGRWTTSGLLVAKGAQILKLPLSLSNGRLAGEPKRLVFGVGAYGSPAIGRDDQMVLSSFSQVRTIERLPLGSADERPVQLFLDSNNIGWRASTSRDGSLIVFERVAGGRREIWSKNLTSGEQRLIMPVPVNTLVNATVSADGSRLTYGIQESGTPDFGRGFVLEIAGGVARPVCEHCTLWGFLPDSRRTIVTDQKSVRFLSDSGATQTVVTTPDNIDRPSVAPNSRAIAFRLSRAANFKTFVAPLLPSGTVAPGTWTQIDEPTNSGRPCGWSPDSSTLYLLLDADGFRDLWGQKVDSTGHTVGKPFVVRHLHHTTGVSTSLGNAITAQGFLYESTRLTGNLWQLAPRASVR